jgi:uncharacterized repeat protein (TIGR04076 family)
VLKNKNFRDTDNDNYELYKLKVEIVKGKDKNGNSEEFVCSHHEGDYFEVEGENLIFKKGQSFSMYALAAILPLLPAKQRFTDENDWMTTDAEVACPDPNCGARFHITRIGTMTQKHSQVTVVPLRK